MNPHTGLAVGDDDLPEAIASVLANPDAFTPRRWFLAHSGSRCSSRRLNALLRGCFQRWNYDWQEDIVPLGSSGASRYVGVEDYRRFLPEFAWILRRFQQAHSSRLSFALE
jgi:hypothetical protein